MRHTKEQLQDILVTAVEGGINYWAKIEYYNPDNTKAAIVDIGGQDDIEKSYTITASIIRRGLKLASQSEHEHIRFMAVRDILDADDADVIVQLGLFSEIIYG